MRPRWNRLQSIPQSVGPAGVEPAFHRVSDGCLAARLRPEEAPCTGLEPVSPARQAGRHTRCVTGRKSVRRESHPPVRRGRSVSRLLGHGHGQQGRKESNPLAPALEAGCSPGSTPLTISGRDRTRTCKGFRLARFPSGCHRACWLALPYRAVPAGLEPATVWLTASRTTVVLRDSKAKRTEQESNLNEAGARLFQGPMTGAPGRTPTLSKSSGGWVRASGLRVFSAALLPPELHRNEQETLVGVEPTYCDFADRRHATRPKDHSQPAVALEPTSSALRGRCPARRASPACFSSSQCWCRANSTGVQSPCPLPRAWPEIQSQRRDSNPHAPL